MKAKHNFKTIYDAFGQGCVKQNQTWIEKRYKIILHLLGHDSPDKNLIDVGGGEGLVIQQLNWLNYKEVIIIDISQQRLREAQKKLGNHNTTYCLADISKGIPLATNSSDNILCLEVIEHIPDGEFLLQELQRIIKKGAHLILSTPNKYAHSLQKWPNITNPLQKFYEGFSLLMKGKLSLYESFLAIRNVIKGRHFTHFREYSLLELFNYFEQYSFKLIEAYGYYPNKKEFLPITTNSYKKDYTTMIFSLVSF